MVEEAVDALLLKMFKGIEQHLAAEGPAKRRRRDVERQHLAPEERVETRTKQLRREAGQDHREFFQSRMLGLSRDRTSAGSCAEKTEGEGQPQITVQSASPSTSVSRLPRWAETGFSGTDVRRYPVAEQARA